MTTKKKKTKKTPKQGERKLNLPTKKIKNTPEYYLCMGDNCHGKNITQVAKKCKSDASSLIAKRMKKMKELARAAKVIGQFAQDLEKILPR